MIKFHWLEVKNFLSVGDNPIKVQLDRSKSTLVTGPNGSGKSGLILDALTFALFGKSYRGINKPKLINSMNQKNCDVKVSFTVNNNEHYVVSRGMNPAYFVIKKNGKELDQEASARDQQKYLEDTILGVNMKAFCQTTLLGSANYIPFMKLNTGARREVIENVLDINVFSDMKAVLKGNVYTHKKQYAELSSKLDGAKERYQMQKGFIEKIQQSTDAKEKEKRDELKTLRERATELKGQVDQIDGEIEEASEDSLKEKKGEVQEQLDAYKNARAELASTKKLLDRQHQFFCDNDQCPTCEQEIDPKYKAERAHKLGIEIEKAKDGMENRDKVIEDLVATKKEYEDNLSWLSNKMQERKQVRSNLDHVINQAQGIMRDIKNLGSDESDLKAEKDKLESIKGEVKTLDDQLREMTEQFEIYELADRLLRDDGIKGSIIRQYLPILNSTVNRYLQILNFNVKFELDEEFNETLRSRYRNEFTYANFSMGERQRLDIALLIAWRHVAQLKNSVNTNLLILDEVLDSSLDDSGIEDLLSIFDQIGGDTNIFVISHRQTMFDKFRSHMRLTKKKGFTQIDA